MFQFISKIFSKKENKQNNNITKVNNDSNVDKEKISLNSIENVNSPIVVINKQINLDQMLLSLIKNGNNFLSKSNFIEAEKCYRQVISINKNHIIGNMNLGWVLLQQNRIEEAKFCLLYVTELNQEHFDAWYGLSKIYKIQNLNEDAIICLNKALKINPSFEMGYEELIILFFIEKRVEEAISFIEEQLKTNNNNILLIYYLACAYFSKSDYENALKYFLESLSLGNEGKLVYYNLGLIYSRLGFLEEANESFDKAKEKDNTADFFEITTKTLSQIAFKKYYEINNTLEKAKIEAEEFNKFIKENVKPYKSWIKKEQSKIRIGFVSGDFRNHPVAYFLLGILRNIDKEKFELFGYQIEDREDSVTLSIKQYFTKWTKFASFQAVVENTEKVYEDAIDVLIDLSGHTSDNGLYLFASKVAPKQISWLGFFGTTGLDNMDYLIADKNCLYENEHQFFKEKIKYLPQTRLSFTAPEECIKINETTPFEINGYITFGCYQNMLKINNSVLKLWSVILKKVPNSIILIQNEQLNNNLTKERFLNELRNANIDSNRIKFNSFTSRKDYLESYNKIDILLDTFPFTGGTTTCEAIWMGVPTVTLNGNTIVGRQSAAMLKCVNLNDWIAESEDEYIDKATSKCLEINELKNLRQNLREVFLNSSLGNQEIFIKDFENLLIDVHNN